MKLIRTATPSGQSVAFWIDQTTLDGLNFGSVSTQARIKIITITKPIMLKVEPYELNLAIQSVGILEMQAWMIISNTVRRNV